MGWLIALAVIVLLAVIPLGISARYDSRGAVAYLLAGPVRLKVYPRPKKAKPQTPQKAAKASAPAQEKESSGGSVRDFLPIVRLILELLSDFRRKLRVDRLEMNVILAGDDPCDLATNYGKAWTALGTLWPQLERLFIIKKRDVKVQCDFEATEILVKARLDLTITLGRLVILGGKHGVHIMKEIITLKNKKGGAAT